jgi:hypothetical protein
MSYLLNMAMVFRRPARHHGPRAEDPIVFARPENEGNGLPFREMSWQTSRADAGQSAEAVVLQLEEPIRVIEGQTPLQERHWLDERLHVEISRWQEPETQSRVTAKSGATWRY